MTPIFFAWLLSLTGAGLFFAAGDMWSRQRKGRKEGDGQLSTLGAELEATRAHMVEQERAKQELRAHEAQLADELSQRHNAFEQLQSELASAKTRSQDLERELSTVRAELEKRGAATDPSTSVFAAADRAAAEKAVADKAATEKSQLERELARLKSEHDAAAQQLRQVESERDQLNRQLELAGADSKVAAVQQELGLTRESLQARDKQLEQLREEAVRLRAVEAELERTKREVAELAEQTRLLRAEAYASKRPPAKRPDRPATISTRGDALQLIVDDETEKGGARSAVIADELGLVVAASGVVSEYGDALAAFGAYLADVGTRTREVLPLHEVRQVVVLDDHDTTLTVRPLATEDPGLALVTLAINMNTAVPLHGRLT